MTFTRKRVRRKRTWLVIGSISTFVIGAIIFYQTEYLPAAEQDKIHIRFKEALIEGDRSFFEETVEYMGEPLSRAEALRFMRWLNDEMAIRGEAIAEIASDRTDRLAGMEADGLFRLMDTGEGKYGFSDYKIELLPQTIEVTSDVQLTNIWLDGERVGRIDEADGTVSIERMPGRYDVKAVAVTGGETVSEIETIDLTETATIDYSLEPVEREAIAGQFDLKRVELIEIEVEARTGHALKTIDGLIGVTETTVVDAIGEPSDRSRKTWRYDGMDVVLDDKRVDYIWIDLDKSPDDLVALIGEPLERKNHEMGTEWRYSQSFFESFFTFFGIQTDKQFIEKDGAMYLLIH